MRTCFFAVIAAAFVSFAGVAQAQTYDPKDIPPACDHPTPEQAANKKLQHNCGLMFRAIKVENGVNGVVDSSQNAAASAWQKAKELGGEALQKGKEGAAVLKEKIKEHQDGK